METLSIEEFERAVILFKEQCEADLAFESPLEPETFISACNPIAKPFITLLVLRINEVVEHRLYQRFCETADSANEGV